MAGRFGMRLLKEVFEASFEREKNSQMNTRELAMRRR